MGSEQSGLGRFAADLPGVNEFVTLGEGNTPALQLGRLASDLGLRRLSAKVESANPTGSYKDRVAAMTVSLARDQGYRGWIATSSGNAGMAMAAYGQRAGLAGLLCVVASAPQEKLRPLVPFGTTVVAVDGVGNDGTATAAADLMECVARAAERYKLFLGITANAFNPDGMRGIDTIGFELAEQVPDASHVYVPTGGGGLLVSLSRGLAGWSAPAIVASQPSGCAPIARCLAGELDVPVIDRCESEISALQLPDPPDGRLAVAAVRASGGWGTRASDEAILEAQRRLAKTEGLFVEPAAATALAALVEDVERGRIGPDDHPVLLLTGAGWKDLGRFATGAGEIPGTDVAGLPDAIDEWASRL